MAYFRTCIHPVILRDELKKIDEQQTGGVKEKQGGRKESREERQIRALKVVFNTADSAAAGLNPHCKTL